MRVLTFIEIDAQVAGLNPTPVLDSLTPSAVDEDTSTFTLEITGEGFLPSTVVRVGGVNRTTTYVDSDTLEITVFDSELTEPGSLSITAVNPSPGGGTSNALTLTIEEVAATDPHFANVRALLHFDGADADDSFIDVIGHTFTTSTSATLDTAQQKFGSASLLLPGSSDFIRSADSADWTLGSSDFTIELWARFASPGASFEVMASHYLASGNQRAWIVGKTATGNLQFNYNTSGASGGANVVEGAWSPASATWYHVAVSRNTTSLRLFVNGAQVGSTHTIGAASIFNSSTTLQLGCNDNNGSNAMNGWVDDFRLTIGTGRYTANFTPPAAAFPDSA